VSGARFEETIFHAALATRSLGRGGLVAAGSLPSTNDAAWDLVREEGPRAAGAVVVADHQTAGRGRFGRAWESPPGRGLLASVVLRLDAPISAARLSALSALAVAETVEAEGVDAAIQWPNDVYARDRKLAGLLLEARDLDPAAPLVVLGLGLNVSQQRAEFARGLVATSILEETGREPRREILLARFLARLEGGLDGLARSGPAPLEAAYRARNRLLGRDVTVLDEGAPLSGTALDLSPEGGLRLRLAGGEERRFAAEHVTIVSVGAARR